MARIVRDWRIDLIETHPQLFHGPAGGRGRYTFQRLGTAHLDPNHVIEISQREASMTDDNDK